MKGLSSRAHSVQSGEDPYDALICRSFSAQEPLIIGLFCGKSLPSYCRAHAISLKWKWRMNSSNFLANESREWLLLTSLKWKSRMTSCSHLKVLECLKAMSLSATFPLNSSLKLFSGVSHSRMTSSNLRDCLSNESREWLLLTWDTVSHSRMTSSELRDCLSSPSPVSLTREWLLDCLSLENDSLSSYWNHLRQCLSQRHSLSTPLSSHSRVNVSQVAGVRVSFHGIWVFCHEMQVSFMSSVSRVNVSQVTGGKGLSSPCPALESQWREYRVLVGRI